MAPLQSNSSNNALSLSGGIVHSMLIMDEVDGMSAGDRGGISALIEIIRTTKIPIVCVCNDR